MVRSADTAAPDLAALRHAVRAETLLDEGLAVARLVEAARRALGPDARERAVLRARALVERCRAQRERAGTLDAFLHEFGLTTREGTALMCLAEALLRVPDEDTADRLIAEKIRSGDWAAHQHHCASPFVNASVWGLMLSGRVVSVEPEALGDPGGWMRRLVNRLGEPVVRAAMLQGMRILAGQFVLGRSIGEAMARGRALAEPGTCFSYDMLGEGARTEADAERYLEAYRSAIRVVGEAATGGDPRRADGVSVKLSALHPRYEHAQRERVLRELLPRLEGLARLACEHGVGLSIDAEEAGRLDLSLELFEALASDPALAGWEGLGFVIQAYQKRALALCELIVALARATGRRIPVRLVKGAYWDAEVKRAQQRGLADYPVFTRKANTDLSFEVCAARLIAAPDAVRPQLATHNAHTLAVALELARGHPGIELQRLHGMGHLLYGELYAGEHGADGQPLPPLRVYAPVGAHRDLLPYLVRRLLENGANSSFVNRFLDAEVPVAALVADTLERVASAPSPRHRRIPRPRAMYQAAGEPRVNAAGWDLDDPLATRVLLAHLRQGAREQSRAAPLVAGAPRGEGGRPVVSPADTRRVVGEVCDAGAAELEEAVAMAAAVQREWDALGGAARAECLERAAGLLERRRDAFIGLVVAEGGRTIADALSEVREAVDFLRYYAWQARERFAQPATLPGPTGEANALGLHGRGVFACISPWNFPLAIFTGQVAAALAAGNTVVAKPAEQTPLVAARAAALLHEAGVPARALHLLPGPGETIGAGLAAHAAIAGVAFTGSIETARRINRQLAGRPGSLAALIAETGGQNAMLVDATALPEQVVDDCVTSAFRSAGQRCSALRVLYLQEEIAEEVLAMLRGAMQALIIGDPGELATDVGPVIDAEARAALEAHIVRLQSGAALLGRCALPAGSGSGHFVAPHAFEIGGIGELSGEVFGPILHVVRFRESALAEVLAEIDGTGYGLTLGVHSRIDGFAEEVFAGIRAGNTYINRDMVGAVVGVQPFGGQRLSGTGPKAGGPHYLPRFATERTRTENLVAKGGNAWLFDLEE